VYRKLIGLATAILIAGCGGTTGTPSPTVVSAAPTASVPTPAPSLPPSAATSNSPSPSATVPATPVPPTPVPATATPAAATPAGPTATPTAPPLSAWTATGSMLKPRVDGALATLLPDGRVLETGGDDPSVDLYDPATGKWTSGAPTAVARAGLSATLLRNGKLLVAGGYPAITSAELYDPATDSWTATGSMHTARYSQSATLLADGTVLVAGGQNDADDAIASAELYNPDTGTWTVTGPMLTARVIHTTTLLNDGKVLVAGGQTGDGSTIFSSTELYAPSTGTWSAAADMANARSYFGAVLMPDGQVLVAGGGGDGLRSAELYDPVAKTWAPTGDLVGEHGQNTVTLLNDGRVLVAGGGGSGAASSELYHPDSRSWSPAGSMSRWRASPTATLLRDGRVLVAGGFTNDNASATAELFDPSSPGPGPTDPYVGLCEPGCQGRTSAGVFTSAGLLPGLQLTFAGDNWFNTADDTAEIQFDQVPATDNQLRFWLDPKASTKTDEPIQSVATTPVGLSDWMATNTDMVVSPPESVTVGDGIAATTFTVLISDANVNVDPGCPTGVRSCLSFLWIGPDHTYAIGYGEAVRLYLFSISIAGSAHTMVVALDTPTVADLAKMTAEVAPILASFRLP
jgi:Galactose oxidase, central domain/Kelch motif